MTTDTLTPADRITHVLIGYSALITSELDRLLPEASVLIFEEPHIIDARDVRRAALRHRCVAEVRAAPTQDERNAEELARAVARPPRVRAVLPRRGVRRRRRRRSRGRLGPARCRRPRGTDSA
jgi:hypothetical protein